MDLEESEKIDLCGFEWMNVCFFSGFKGWNEWS